MPKINYPSKQNLTAPPPPSESNAINGRTVPLQASCKTAFQMPQSITDKLPVAH